VVLLPTCTLPKLMLEEVGISTLGGLIPVPESGTESEELGLMFESQIGEQWRNGQRRSVCHLAAAKPLNHPELI
jgi:hypothetical protein